MTITPEMLLFTATALGVVVALWLRVWSSRTLHRPSRLGPDEPVASLVMVMSVGFLALFLASAAMGKILGPKPSDLQTTIGQTITQAISIAAILIAGKRIRGEQARRLGLNLRAGSICRGIFTAIVGSCVALPATIWTNEETERILRRFAPNVDRMHPLMKALQDHPSQVMRIWVTISAVAAAPLAEELFFRGYLQTALREFTRQPWLTLVITACAFAYMHQAWSWPAIFVLAICLGYAYERTGNLWTCIFMHAIFNGTELILLRTSG